MTLFSFLQQNEAGFFEKSPKNCKSYQDVWNYFGLNIPEELEELSEKFWGGFIEFQNGQRVRFAPPIALYDGEIVLQHGLNETKINLTDFYNLSAIKEFPRTQYKIFPIAELSRDEVILAITKMGTGGKTLFALWHSVDEVFAESNSLIGLLANLAQE